MAKETEGPSVVWQLNGDAMRPTPAPWGFIGRNPVQRAIPAGQRIQIDLQVVGNVPLMVFPTRMHVDDVTVDGPAVVPAGASIRVIVENRSSVPMIVDDGEGLVGLHPLLFSGTSEVG